MIYISGFLFLVCFVCLSCASFIPVLIPLGGVVCVVCAAAAAAAAFIMPQGMPFSFGFKKDCRKDCRKIPGVLVFGDDDHGTHENKKNDDKQGVDAGRGQTSHSSERQPAADDDPLDAFMARNDAQALQDKQKAEAEARTLEQEKLKAKAAAKAAATAANENGASQDDAKTQMHTETNATGTTQQRRRFALKRRFENDDDDGDNDNAKEEEEEEDMETWKRNVLAGKTESDRLGVVDHATVEYAPFRKMFYVEPREIAALTEAEVATFRAETLGGVRIRGARPVPKPVKRWAHLGLSPPMLHFLSKTRGYDTPTAIQAQVLPALMGGRNVVGVAKTGSGKTLAYLLPLVRHVKDQRAVDASAREGPIALVMAPTRELVIQVGKELKRLCVVAGAIRVATVYGGAGVAGQIGELRRGAEAGIATPGRLIDLLATTKSTNLTRVTFVVLDEADRMFDLGFEPQITRILDNIRPDKQAAFFSATFPRSLEALALRHLKRALIVVIGGRAGVVNESIVQRVEVQPKGSSIVKSNRFRRLLELLGDYHGDEGSEGHTNLMRLLSRGSDGFAAPLALKGGGDRPMLPPPAPVSAPSSAASMAQAMLSGAPGAAGLELALVPSSSSAASNNSKVLIFVNSQTTCDSLLTHLFQYGYPCLSLHGGKEQTDRESTLHDYRMGVCDILIATSVAARGLDVPNLNIVVNYDTPDHLEDYVHRVGRTGRAGNRGLAVTFISDDSADEERKYAPDLVKALTESKQAVPADLQKIASEFEVARKKGEAKGHGSGFGGRGFDFEGSREDKSKKAQRKMMKELGYIDDDDAEEEEEEEEDKKKKEKERGGPSGAGGGRAKMEVERAADGKILEFSNASALISQSTLKVVETGAPTAPRAPQMTNAGASDVVMAAQRAAQKLQVQIQSGSEMVTAPSPPSQIQQQPQANLQSTKQAAAIAAAQQFASKIAVPPISISPSPPPGGAMSAADVLAAAQATAAAIASSLPGVQAAARTTGPIGSSAAATAAAAPGGLKHYRLEFEINDFPQHARWKATHRESIAAIQEKSGAALTVRGQYFPPGSTPDSSRGERKLFLVIEGGSESVVKAARAEVKRVIEEATARGLISTRN